MPQPEFEPPAEEVVRMQLPSTEAVRLPSQILAKIDCLPNELLTWIFQLCICASVIANPSCDVHRHLKRQLTSVSRRWRDIIRNAANLWTTIRLSPTWGESLVKAHLARSSESSLDIEMCGPWPRNALATIHAQLDLLITCSHRWRSVVARCDVGDVPLVQLLTAMKDKTLPSLTHFSVEYMHRWLCNNWVASQLRPEHFPRLQHLRLGGSFDPSTAGQAPPNLTSLAFVLDEWGILYINQHFSLQKLTSLYLSGCAMDLRLDPSSIQLPLLKKFVCAARDGHFLIHAIAAPNLLHLQYDSGQFGLANDQWNLHTPRYPNVTDLVLPRCGIGGSNKIASFQFPAVRHVTLHKRELCSFFGPGDDTTAAMYWLDLETLTVGSLDHNDDDNGVNRDSLVAWLQRRQEMGRPNLLVNVTLSSDYKGIGDISSLYLALHRYCTLQVAGIHFDPAVDLIFGDELTVCVFVSLPLHIEV